MIEPTADSTAVMHFYEFQNQDCDYESHAFFACDEEIAEIDWQALCDQAMENAAAELLIETPDITYITWGCIFDRAIQMISRNWGMTLVKPIKATGPGNQNIRAGDDVRLLNRGLFTAIAEHNESVYPRWKARGMLPSVSVPSAPTPDTPHPIAS
jgi:hypothetical protein